MATFDDIWKFLEFGNWKSGNLESARNWLVLANFNILGIFSFQFRSLSLILNSEFQNFQFFWNFSRNFLEIWKFSGICYFWPISTCWASFPRFGFGFCGIGAATDRRHVSWYIPLQESQIATLRDHRTSIWLAFFMCSVFTSQSISNSYIKLVILYSPVQFLTPSHNLSVAAERLGERNTWLYSSAVNICFWLHLYIFLRIQFLALSSA